MGDQPHSIWIIHSTIMVEKRLVSHTIYCTSKLGVQVDYKRHATSCKYNEKTVVQLCTQHFIQQIKSVLSRKWSDPTSVTYDLKWDDCVAMKHNVFFHKTNVPSNLLDRSRMYMFRQKSANFIRTKIKCKLRAYKQRFFAVLLLGQMFLETIKTF